MGWDANSPWSIDYFNPPKPHVPAPSPKARVPKVVPEVERLFSVQRNALKVLNDLQSFKDGEEIPPRALQSLQRDAENTYRVINTWLKNHADQESL